jgi:hypothetical protein
MKKFFPVLSRDKASSSASQEPSNTRHPSEPQNEVTPNSANEGIQVVDYNLLETDPGLRSPISSYHPNIQDEVRKAYLKKGRYKPSNFVYPWSDHGRQRRRFCKNWFNLYDWIEYSESKDLAFQQKNNVNSYFFYGLHYCFLEILAPRIMKVWIRP